MKDYRRIVGYKAKLANRIRALNPTLANDLQEVQLPWYYIRNADGDDPSVEKATDNSPEPTAAEIFIYDEIGGSMGVSADEFVKDLQGIKAKEITVRINSPGGSVFDAIAIYNALIQHPANVTTRVDALAASAASIIAMAGDTVEMMVGSQLMIHDAMGMEMGNAKEMREMAKFLDGQSDNLASIYANKGGDKQDWRAMMLAETWMFAQEAVDLGLADSVYTRSVKRELEEAATAEGEEVPGVSNEGDEPDGDEPETDSESEGDSEEEDDKESEAENLKALAHLMTAKHRMTNRGYKYSSRDRAPAPPVNENSFSSLLKGW